MNLTIMSAGFAIYLLQAAPSQVASVRMLAAILLVVLLCGLIYVLRRVKTLKVETKSRAAPSNIIFIACAVTFILACVLLYLVAKA